MFKGWETTFRGVMSDKREAQSTEREFCFLCFFNVLQRLTSWTC